jgi:protocatechuate 3,4-dioxygenase beta subunit
VAPRGSRVWPGLAALGLVLAALLVGLLLRSRADSPASDTSVADPSVTGSRTDASELADEPERSGTHARIRGQVIDEHDAPIAHAHVCISPGELARMAELRWQPRCGRANDNGEFEFDAIAPGRYRLSAAKRGYIPPPILKARVGLTTSVVAGQQREGLILRLRRGGAEVRGIVSDITGGTISDAQVFSDAALTYTDGDGRFSLWLDVSSFVDLHVSAEGYARATITEHRPSGRELQIQLRPEVVLVGRVIHADTGEPVAGVPVVAKAPPLLLITSGFATQPHVLTDADGRFRFTGLGPGRYKPEVHSGGFRGMARESVLLVLGVEHEELVIRVHPARQLAGRVTHAGSGDPCDAGGVTIHDGAGAVVERGLADATGAIAVGGLLPGMYTLEIKCDESDRGKTSEVVDLTEEDLVDALWEIEARSGRAVRGRVLDSSGRAVAMAYVQGELREPEDAGTQALARAVTESDGSFEILDLPPGVYVFDRVRAEGLPEPREGLHVALADDRDTEGVEIVLPRAGALRVWVRDASGSPVPDASIFVGEGGGGQVWKSTPTSEWLFDPIASGVYHVKVLRAGIGGRAGPGEPGEPVIVIPGATAELTLLAAARSGMITGFVRTREGEPVADAVVRAIGSETFVDFGGREQRPEVAQSSTDIDGYFILRHLEDGTYTVRANSQGVEQSLDAVQSGARDVVLELPNNEGSVAGRVVVDGGEPPSRFTISLTPDGSPRRRTEEFLFTEGEWRVAGLSPGEWVVEVAAAEGTASLRVEIPDGGERDGVQLVLAARATARGRVVDPETGKPVVGYLATIVSSHGGAKSADLDLEGTRHTGTDGQFELRNVPSGTVTLHLWPGRADSYGHVELSVELEAGGTTDVGTIEAVVLRSTNQPQNP